MRRLLRALLLALVSTFAASLFFGWMEKSEEDLRPRHLRRRPRRRLEIDASDFDEGDTQAMLEELSTQL